jgi:hypothetical protein
MNKLISIIVFLLSIVLSGFINRPAACNFFQNSITFGYLDKGDSIQFQFGEQKKIKVGSMEFDLDKRRNEIKRVNLAGDFNGWSPENTMFVMKKTDNKLYELVVSKKSIGKKGEVHKFKFVLNGEYWIEPPQEALNKITGSDHNTNLYLKF